MKLVILPGWDVNTTSVTVVGDSEVLNGERGRRTLTMEYHISRKWGDPVWRKLVAADVRAMRRVLRAAH